MAYRDPGIDHNADAHLAAAQALAATYPDSFMAGPSSSTMPTQQHSIITDPQFDMSAEGEPPAKRARVRQACTECRDAKLRCDLGDPGEPKDPPCHRCSRSGRECRFVGSHLHHKPRKMNYRKSMSAPDEPPESVTASAQPAETSRPRDKPSGPISLSPEVFERRTSTSETSLPARSPYRPGINFAATIETPADALRVLVAAADEESATLAAPLTHQGDGKIWNQWEPVRDGLLTTEEARTLLAL